MSKAKANNARIKWERELAMLDVDSNPNELKQMKKSLIKRFIDDLRTIGGFK